MLATLTQIPEASLRQSSTGAGSVLIVEDDRILRESIVELLTMHGLTVAWATDGQDALSTFRADPADMILTDIIMPKMGGLGLVKQIREFDFETPILILTGYASLDNCVEALRAGANDFIAKPFENAVLVEAVKRAIDGAKAHASVRLLDKNTHQEIRISVPSSIRGFAESPVLVTEILARIDAAVLAAGMRRRRLAIRRALDEAVLLGLDHLAGNDSGPLDISAEFDPRRCAITIAGQSPLFPAHLSAHHDDASGPGRRKFLIHSFCDEVTWSPDSRKIEMVFFRPRTERPEKQGA
ncbi:MAG: response regulator [Candidatus Hydrogenedentota bacterium]